MQCQGDALEVLGKVLVHVILEGPKVGEPELALDRGFHARLWRVQGLEGFGKHCLAVNLPSLSVLRLVSGVLVSGALCLMFGV